MHGGCSYGSSGVCCKQVHWAKDDTEGRPVLVVHLQAALKQDAAGAKRAAEAILTHMEYCLQQRMRDDLSGPEQVVVVLDSRGAPTLQVRPAAIPAFSGLREPLHRLGLEADQSCFSHSPCDDSPLRFDKKRCVRTNANYPALNACSCWRGGIGHGLKCCLSAVPEAGHRHSEHSADTEPALPCAPVPPLPCRCARHRAPSCQGKPSGSAHAGEYKTCLFSSCCPVQCRTSHTLEWIPQKLLSCDCVQAIKAMLHPSTSSKILICDSEDERLPVDLTQDSTPHQDGQL